jgi:biotin carboxylase
MSKRPRAPQMKTIMIIGAGKAQMPLIEAAKREGYYTITCDWNPEAPGIQLADEFCKVSTKDRFGLYETTKEKKIDGIVANSEYAMCDVAFISSELGLVGNPESAIAVLSSKSQFRKLQKQIGLFTPIVVDIGELDGLSYPLIIKPDMNSGTRGTTVIKNETERDNLKTAIETCSRLSRNGKAIVEEYIPISPETVIEGEILVHNGEILWDGLFRSIRSELTPMIPMTYVFPLVEERKRRLQDALEKAFCAAGVCHGEYNIEACFVNDNPFIIEINPRQGGNDLPRYVQEHCGIDYYKLLVTTAVGNDEYWDSLGGLERQNNKITHHMLYPRKNGRFRGVCISDEVKDCIFRTQINVAARDEIKKADDGSASIGYVDLMFEDLQKQIEISRRLEDLIRIEVDED